MSPRLRLSIVIGVAALGAHACADSASTSMNVTSPAGVRCQATVTNSASSFAAAGGTGSVAVTVPRECNWSAVSRSPWLTITSGQEGQGDGTVAYRVDENGAPAARQATLVVSEREIAVAQAAAPCRFEVRAEEGPVPPQGGDLRVELGTHDLCDWSASSEVAWASVTPSAGRGPAAVEVNVGPNAGGSRTVSVVVANQRISLTQAALPAPPPPPPTPVPAPPPPTPTPTPTPTPAPTPAPAPAPPPPPPPPPAPAPAPTPVRRVDIEGRISGLAGSCPAVTFAIRGEQVYTTSQTRYDDGRCSRLRNGREVEIAGTLMSDGRIRADEVEIDD